MSKAFSGYAPRPNAPNRSQVPWMTHVKTYPHSGASRAVPYGGGVGHGSEYGAEYKSQAGNAPSGVHYFPRQDPLSKESIRTFQPRAHAQPHPESIRAPLSKPTTVPLSPSGGLTAPFPPHRDGTGLRSPIYQRHQAPREWAQSGLRTYPGYGNRSTLHMEHVWVPMKFDYATPQQA